MVRLVLHNTSGEKATIQFGTTDGGMSISGTSDKVEFIGGDEPLMSVEREGDSNGDSSPVARDDDDPLGGVVDYPVDVIGENIALSIPGGGDLPPGVENLVTLGITDKYTIFRNSSGDVRVHHYHDIQSYEVLLGGVSQAVIRFHEELPDGVHDALKVNPLELIDQTTLEPAGLFNIIPAFNTASGLPASVHYTNMADYLGDDDPDPVPIVIAGIPSTLDIVSEAFFIGNYDPTASTVDAMIAWKIGTATGLTANLSGKWVGTPVTTFQVVPHTHGHGLHE